MFSWLSIQRYGQNVYLFSPKKIWAIWPISIRTRPVLFGTLEVMFLYIDLIFIKFYWWTLWKQLHLIFFKKKKKKKKKKNLSKNLPDYNKNICQDSASNLLTYSAVLVWNELDDRANKSKLAIKDMSSNKTKYSQDFSSLKAKKKMFEKEIDSEGVINCNLVYLSLIF